MDRKSRTRRAFSLIELVIVVVILGIIAAIAIPRLSSGTRNAGDAALRANLQTLRNAIDWYYGEHNMTFPGKKAAGGLFGVAESEDAFKNQLMFYTNAAGAVSEDKDALFPYGPYIRGNFPALSVGTAAGNDEVSMTTDVGAMTADDATGWMYSTVTGNIMANSGAKGADGDFYYDY